MLPYEAPGAFWDVHLSDWFFCQMARCGSHVTLVGEAFSDWGAALKGAIPSFPISDSRRTNAVTCLFVVGTFSSVMMPYRGVLFRRF
jgi:hypothetical protein